MRPSFVPALALAATLVFPALAQNPLHDVPVEQLAGRSIHGSNGEEIGKIEQLVIGPRGEPAAVVGVGGILGIGEHEVAIPVDRLRPGEGDRLTTGMTKEQIQSIDRYDASAYRPITGGRTIGEAIGD
jgi:hypothetical protein